MPTPAKNLSDVYKTLDPRPLTKPDEFKAFYREGLDKSARRSGGRQISTSP